MLIVASTARSKSFGDALFYSADASFYESTGAESDTDDGRASDFADPTYTGSSLSPQVISGTETTTRKMLQESLLAIGE